MNFLFGWNSGRGVATREPKLMGGVESSRELLSYSEEELSNQGIVKVSRPPRRAVGGPPSPTLSITFDRLVLPLTLMVGWLSLKVREFVPKPRQCYFCLQFGHLSLIHI